jgi:ABC-type amino acid transport system permease subunit
MTFNWNYMLSLLSDADFWQATWTVIKLSLLTWGSIVLGFILALAKQSPRKLFHLPARSISGCSAACRCWLLIFVYNMPQALPSFAPVLNDPFWAGLLAMVLSEAAYIAEIHRGGLLSIPKGQSEAARALGLRYAGTQWRVIIQALRVALPALANEYIAIVKLSSLVSVISLTEILMVGQRSTRRTSWSWRPWRPWRFTTSDRHGVRFPAQTAGELPRCHPAETTRPVDARCSMATPAPGNGAQRGRQPGAGAAGVKLHKPITTSKCWGPSACKFSPARWSRSSARPAPGKPR